MKRQVIFAGRFQPFHFGQKTVIRDAMTLIAPEDVFVLGVIAQMGIEIPAADQKFAEAAEEHHRPERNPWPLWVRIMALMEVAKSIEQFVPQRKIIVTAIPRPDYGWRQIQTWFSGPRIWVIPVAQEYFDEQKAAFFEAMGDQILRCKDDSGISGRELRNMWEKGLVDNMKKHLPECVHSAYCP